VGAASGSGHAVTVATWANRSTGGAVRGPGIAARHPEVPGLSPTTPCLDFLNDLEGLAARVCAARVAEPFDQAGDLVGLEHLVFGEFGKEVAEHPGVDGARGDTERADADRAAFGCETPGEGLDERLAASVRGKAGERIARCHRRHVDDD